MIDFSYAEKLAKSKMNNSFKSSLDLVPKKPVPVEDFLNEIKLLNFYHHGSDRGHKWSSCSIYGISEKHTDHPSKYGIENPENTWCNEVFAPKITEYFKNDFMDMEYSRIRVMRLEPNGMIRPHSDNKNNKLSAAINIELGPDKVEFSMMTRIGTMNLNLYPGRVYLFNNHYYHTVANKKSTKRYQIIVHGKFKDEHLYNHLEPFTRGVYRNGSENIDGALWYSTGNKKGAGCGGIPIIADDLNELKEYSSDKKGLFLRGDCPLKVKVWTANKETMKQEEVFLHEYFYEWVEEDLPTIETEYFTFWNPHIPEPIEIPWTNKILTEKHHDGYWTYTTDAVTEFSSPHDLSKIDLIIAPSTGTSLEQLSKQFECKNFLAYNITEGSNLIHKEIRDYVREKGLNGYEAWEKTTRNCCYKRDYHCNIDVNPTSQTNKFFRHFDPRSFTNLINEASYEYMVINMIEEPEKLIPYVKDKRVVINLSNIFSFILSVRLYSLEELEEYWENVIDILDKNCSLAYIMGQDPYKVEKRIVVGKDS